MYLFQAFLLFRWSKCLPSRLVCPHDSVSSLAKNFACGWPQFIIFTSHLLIFLFYPLRGNTLVSYLETIWLVLSQYCLLYYSLLCYSWEKWVKIREQSHYIITYQASRNISAKSLQTPGLSVLSELAGHSRGKILRWGERRGQKTTSVKDELQIRLTKG